jgi:hypothetical protein
MAYLAKVPQVLNWGLARVTRMRERLTVKWAHTHRFELPQQRLIQRIAAVIPFLKAE